MGRSSRPAWPPPIEQVAADLARANLARGFDLNALAHCVHRFLRAADVAILAAPLDAAMVIQLQRCFADFLFEDAGWRRSIGLRMDITQLEILCEVLFEEGLRSGLMPLLRAMLLPELWMRLQRSGLTLSDLLDVQPSLVVSRYLY
jgi:hypothetical protein